MGNDGGAFVVALAVPILLSEVAKKPTKVRGQKSHIAVDFTGLLLAAIGWARVSPWRLMAAGRRASNVGARSDGDTFSRPRTRGTA